MISKLLKLLLLILAFCGWIRLAGQTDSTSKICLTFKQFDFFADALVERNFLRLDTADLHVKECAYLQIIKDREFQLHLDTLIFNQKDQAIQKQQVAYGNLAADYRKVEKSRNGWRGFGLGTSAAILVTAVVLVLTNR